jgi:hypothetical protein
MGTVFTSDSAWLNRTYIIGFTSYEGTAGRLTVPEYKVDKPERNGFENWIDPKLDYAFVDFRKFNASAPDANENFYMAGAIKGGQYHKDMMACWNYVFDGVVFIRKMYPCRKI